MELSNIRPAAGSNDTKFRRGRGHASGNGKTAGFGHKGQKARSGRPRAGFEGGQMPLYRRLPKRGFKNYNKKNIVTVDVTKLEKFENGAVVDIQALLDAGIISDVYDGVKVIGNGELTKKLTVKVDAFSAGAKEKIESVGGTAEIAE
jgi:large subunit ribosomal protein L15